MEAKESSMLKVSKFTHENTISLLLADIIATDHRGMVMNHDQFVYHSSRSYSFKKINK